MLTWGNRLRYGAQNKLDKAAVNRGLRRRGRSRWQVAGRQPDPETVWSMGTAYVASIV